MTTSARKISDQYPLIKVEELDTILSKNKADITIDGVSVDHMIVGIDEGVSIDVFIEHRAYPLTLYGDYRITGLTKNQREKWIGR